MIHQHPFRKWTIDLSDDSGFLGDHYEVSWRNTIRLGRPCELFTIHSDHDPDDAFVQIMLFDDGSTQAWTWHPAMIQISPAEMRIAIGILKPDDCIFDRSATSRDNDSSPN